MHFSGKLAAVFIVALVFLQLNCMIVCAKADCLSMQSSNTQNLPPCHRHSGSSHEDSAPCVATATAVASAPTPQSAVLTPVYVSLSISLWLSDIDYPLTGGFPRDRIQDTPSVLRI